MTTNHFRIIVLALAGVAGISAALKVRVVAGEETPAAVKTGRDWLDVPRPERVPMPAAEEIETAIRRGTDFLLERQLTHGDAHGAWGSATRTKGLNIYAPVPGAHEGFRAAVTSLCLSALIEGTDRRPEVIAAIEAGERWLLEHLGNVRRANQDAIYNVWAHAYAIEALADLHGYRHDDPDKQAQLRQMIVGQIDRLDRYESVDGGWGYYDFRAYAQQPSSNPTSFTTATALIAFHDARSLGIEIPDRLVRRAIACVERQQKPDFSYYYSDNGPVDNQPMRSINRPGGSLGRSQACNLALRLWDRPEITDRVLDAWLARLFSRNLW
ncbi:MAG: hypothetical protein KDA99_13275, partial [Planctomycetales bacterium]|nr:hypothetical protein [Planctomycetales bacterium]